MFKKKLGFLVGVMLLMSLAGYLICTLTNDTKQLHKEEEFLLVTSFYPMYVLAENLTEGVEGVQVSNLTENQTGCLHDYQLTTRDMKLLSEADTFLINGAGMELFMEKVMENQEALPVLEAAHGITLLEGTVYNHDHEEEHSQEEHDHEEEHFHAGNGHVWMDLERYREQLSTVTKELQALLPEQAKELEAAAEVYDDKLQELNRELELLREQTKGVPVVIFHEAFVYLADSLGMEVLMALSMDEETVPSAGDIAEVIEEINYHGSALILIEEAYAEHAEKIKAETDARVVYLDPLVTGDGTADSYINGMRNNLEAVKAATE